MRLVLDTSVLIDHLRGGKVWDKLFDEFEGLVDIEFCIPIIVLFELYSGQSSRNKSIAEKIKNLLRNFQKIELTENIAQRAGEIYRDSKIKSFGAADYIIAASALEIGAQVVTLNKKHFEKIPGINLYNL